MEKQLQDLEVQLKLLEFTRKKSDVVIGKRNTQGIERQPDALRAITKEVENSKVSIEQGKFASGEEAADITKWSEDVEEQQAAADEDIVRLEKCLADAKQEVMEIMKENEEKLLTKSRQARLEFEKAQLELKMGYATKSNDEATGEVGEVSNQNVNAGTNAKLPKLVITRFNGGYTDWQRFWNQFEAEIDRANVAGVTKFSYLKELVEPSVRATIDGLPFSTEGYERAKNILKDRYGKTSEIVNAYIKNIMSLPKINGSHTPKIHEFYQCLLMNAQALQTMGKLSTVNGYVRMTLDKLEGIRGDLVRTDDDWQEWDFPKLVDALQGWTTRNPIPVKDALCEQIRQDKPARNQDKPARNRFQAYQTHQSGWKRMCVYCDGPHKDIECEKVIAICDRKRILSTKRLCFNYTGEKHVAADCKSRSLCQKCQQAHHTSICDHKRDTSINETKAKSDRMMTATTPVDSPVIYPVVVVKVEGVMCRALLDTGSGSSYASAALLDKIGVRPHQREVRQIEMMLGSVTKVVEISKVKVESISGDFKLNVSVTKVNKQRLLDLENPRYQDCISIHAHLAGVEMQDIDTKKRLPVHLILGASDYTKIKTQTVPRIGTPGEPIAEQTRFGWTIMSPGEEVDLSPMFVAQTSTVDYEDLCRLDVLGLQDFPEGDQNQIYNEFKEQLVRSPEGWYETGLPWKGNHPPLPNNEAGSLRRLQSLQRKLENQGLTERYHKIIQEQLETGIVERVTDPPNGREFYIPHKPVVREAAESTKLRVVYDASARAYDKAPSLNECLNPGPPLQNQLWNVLVRIRFHPVAITGDIKQAFLQVRIREEDRDALRFHWLKDLDTKTVETLRFTRALFGLAPSPFLLGGVLKHHLEVCKSTYPEIVGEIEKSLYVDDLISGGPTVERALQIKTTATEIFAKGGFELHKWHSSARELETTELTSNGGIETFAKEQLGIPKGGESTLLGLTWSKEADTISIRFPTDSAQPTKRGILGKVARIYDPLGLTCPVTLGGKFLYRDACDVKLAWDTELPSDLINRWSRWEGSLPDEITVPRSIATHQEEIEEVELHAFGDASGKGVCAAVYAVIKQPTGVNQGLVAAKARLAKKGLTIPRLELVSGHMAVNLLTNVSTALDGYAVSSRHGWLDSSVALHWIRGQGQYKQFVANRVQKIQDHPEITWHHLSTTDNPADVGSRSGKVSEHTLWWKGPLWLTDKKLWPPDITTTATSESQAEAKALREVFAVAVEEPDELDALLQRCDYWRTMRVCGWVMRFIQNARAKKAHRVRGPLTTREIETGKLFWVKRAQANVSGNDQYEEDKLQLNLQLNDEGVLECRGRIQGEYPVFLPDNQLYTQKFVINAHLTTLHGGVGLPR